MAECLKLSYRVKIRICNWGWTKIAKWKSRTWSSDTYGSLLTRWWNVMVQKVWNETNPTWVLNIWCSIVYCIWQMACIEICSCRIQKIREEVLEWPEITNKENVTCKSHTNITFLKKVIFLEERLSLPKREIPRRNFLEETKYLL